VCLYLFNIGPTVVTVHCNLPELRLPPRDTIDPNILCFPQCQAYRSSILVAPVLVLVVPLLSITKEKRLAMSLQSEVFSTQSPCSRSRRVSHTDTVAQPVLNVVVPCQLATDGYVAILEFQVVHYFGNGVVARGDFNLPISTALFEGIHQSGRVVFGVGRGNGAKATIFGHAGQRCCGKKP
jgi:hypothetical protein